MSMYRRASAAEAPGARPRGSRARARRDEAEEPRVAAAADALRFARRHEVLTANDARYGGRFVEGAGGALLDRLRLDEKRVEAMAQALEAVADLPDPIGTVLARVDPANGLHIQRAGCRSA